MARTIDYTAHFKADDDITPAAEDAARALDKLESQGDVTVKFRGDTKQVQRDITDVLAKVDRLAGTGAANLVLTSNARTITNEIADLVVEMNQLDAADPTLDVKATNIRDLEDGLERIQTKAREINGTPVELDTRPAVSGLDNVGKSADSSRSVLANMVGNATQDLGALGGVAGSAGVAIGQMGEYMVDAASSGDKLGTILRNFAVVAGPIALIAAAIQVASGLMAEQAAEAEAAAARTKSFGEAMSGAADDTVGLTGALRDSIAEMKDFRVDAGQFGDLIGQNLRDVARQLPLVGQLFSEAGADIVRMANRAGLSIYQLAGAAEGVGAPAWDEYRAAVDAAVESGKLSEDQAEALSAFINQQARAVDDAREAQELSNVSQREANALLQETLKQRAPLEQMADVWATLFADMADGTIDTEAAAEAINTLATNLGLTREEVIALAQEDLARQLDESTQAAEESAAALAETQAAMKGVSDAFADGAESAAALGRAFATFNADSDLSFSQMATDTVEAFDNIKTAIGEVQDIGSKPLVPTTVEDLRGLSDESAAVVDALGGMRQAIQTELGAALESAGGNFDAVREKAGFFRDEVTAQFTAAFTEMGLGPAEVEDKVTELLGTLGLLPSQVETVIRVSEAEEATRKIELFGSAIANLPPEVQAKVAAAVDANDPVTAWNLINSGVQAQGAVPVATTADPAGFASGMGELTGGDYETTVEVGSDTGEAETGISDVEDGRYGATVGVDANTALAATVLLAFLTQPRVVKIFADLPNIEDVNGYLNAAAGPRRAPIDAYLRDYPTATEIANRIGVVRVPIDAYVRTLPRINGSLDG